ncbi:hypothetical protein [Microvirga arabica]|uniref:hypothetical protein n=1 Tax=Microvirga arabica TaxID=1128671 RepID=UPI001939E933|nr:hypothetical protein [Microvirga arabica]MBM1171278.1 hypothetical protein [Microvirga arabica]
MSFQTFASLQNQRILILGQTSKYVAVATEHLYALLRPDISRIRVDADWYLSKHPDVREAVERGEVSSAEEHYHTSGYFEHRMPYPIVVDERWYLEQYPDIQNAVSEGIFDSGQHHFDVAGYREGRYPFAQFRLEQAQE